MQTEKIVNSEYNQNEYLTNVLEKQEFIVEEDTVIVDGYKFKIDRTVPKIIDKVKIGNGFIPEINYVEPNEIEISVEISQTQLEEHIQKFEFYIGNNKFETKENKYIITDIEENKEYSIYIIIYDDLGNCIQSVTQNIELEKIYHKLTENVTSNDSEKINIFADNNSSDAFKSFDGNYNTYWDGGNVDSFIGVEFEIPTEVTSIKISQPYTIDIIKDFIIQYSDDNNYYYDATDILTYTGGKGPQEFNLKSNLGKHKYWRYQNLTGYRKTNYCAITELEFYITELKFNKRID